MRILFSLFQLNLYDALSQQPSGEYSLVADNPYREMLGKVVCSMLYTHGLAQCCCAPTHTYICTCNHDCLRGHNTHTSVRKVIPLLAESREVRIEHPLIRTGGHKTLLKTSHLCQWLESAASYYATLTAQSSLHKQGK